MIVVLLGLALVGGVWGQSQIPAEDTNFLAVTGNTDNGDTDAYQVVFFQVPKTVTGPLYFAVYDPGVDDAAGTGGPDTDPDQGNTGNWEFRLYGGTGTLTGTNAKEITLSLADATRGTQRGTTIGGAGDAANTDETWWYFEPVYPNDGELIGNSYYFKVFATHDNGSKNAFQLDVSYTPGSNVSGNHWYGGTPTGVGDVRAFAYAWTLNLLDRTVAPNSWDLYPFVPDSANDSTGQITRHFWDFDDLTLPTDSGQLFNKDGVSVATGLTGDGSADTNSSYAVTGQRNGTWQLRITEDNGAEVDINTSMVWFTGTNPVENYRTYAAPYNPSPADHAVVTPTTASVFENNPVTMYLQLLDSDGNEAPYVRTVRVTAASTGPGTVVINGVDNDELVTTNSEGYATFTVNIASVASGTETVTVTLTTDGELGASRLPETGTLGTNGSAVLTFSDSADLLPTMTHAALSFDQGSTANVPEITIRETNDGGGPSNVTAANDLRIRIPDTLSVAFNTGVTPDITGTGSGKVTGTSFESDKVFLISLNADLADNETLIVGNSTQLALTTVNSPSSDYLTLSYSGSGGPYNIFANNLITVRPGTVNVWDGSTDSDWGDPDNWASGTVPNSSTVSVIIPSAGITNFPVLDAARSVLNLTIGEGASLDLNGQTLTLAGTMYNDGTLILDGVSAEVSGISAFDVDSGTIEYAAASGGPFTGLVTGNTYNNLTINSTQTYTLDAGLDVNGDLTLSGGTLNDGGQTISVAGDWTGGAVFAATTGTVQFDGSGTTVVTGVNTFYNLTIDTPGKVVRFTNGQTQTVSNVFRAAGINGSLVRLLSTTSGSQWTLSTNGTNADVSFAAVQDSLLAGTNDINAYSSSSLGNNDDTISPRWTFPGDTYTWTGGTNRNWNNAGNWDIGDGTPGDDGTPDVVDSAIVPSAPANQPRLNVAASVRNLTVQAGASLEIDGNDLTVANTLTNVGTIIARGDGTETVNATLNTDSGIVRYIGDNDGVADSFATLPCGADYYELQFASTDAGADADSWNIGTAVTTTYRLSATSAGSLTFSNVGNSLPRAGVTGTANLTLATSGALVMETTTLTGALSLTGGGILTDSGLLSVAGSTTLEVGAGNDITLDGTGSGNFLTGPVTVSSARDVTLRDQDALQIGASTISQHFTVVAGGDITNPGAVTVTGTADFTTTGGSAITLDNAGNNFATFAARTTGTVTVADAGAIELGGIDDGAGGSATTLIVTAGNAITDSGPTLVSGVSTFNATANGIILNDSANDFGTVVLNGGGDATLLDVDDIVLGATGAAMGNVTVTAGGAITQSGIIAATSLLATTTVDGGALINLGTSANTITTVNLQSRNGANVIDDAGAINYQGGSGFAIGTAANGGAGIRTTGALSLTSTGAITQTGEVLAGGTTTLAAGAANDITLTDTANDFGVISVTSGNNVSITDVNDVDIGAVTTAGTFLGTSLGGTGITVSGAVASGGATTLRSDAITITTGTISAAAGAGTVYLLPNTLDTAISVGGAAAFDLTQAELIGITAGLIEIGRDATPVVTAGAATLVSAASVDIGTRNLRVSTRNGNDIVAGAVAGHTLTTTGTLTLVADGAIEGTSDDAVADLSAGTLVLTAGVGTGVGDGIGATTPLDIVVGAGGITADTTASNANIDLDVTSGGLSVNLVSAGTGTVSLDVAGAITSLATDGTTDLSGATISLVAGAGGTGGIGGSGSELEVSPGTGTLSTSTAAATVSGDQFIDVIGNVDIGRIDAAGGSRWAVTLRATGDIDVAALANNDDTAEIVAGALDLVSDRDNNGTGTIGATAAIEIDAAGDVSASNGTSNGGIALEFLSNTTIGAIIAGTGTVTISSAAATTVNDSAANPDTTTDITASALVLVSGGSVGGTADLDLNVDTISVSAAVGAIDLVSNNVAATTITYLRARGATIDFTHTTAADVTVAAGADAIASGFDFGGGQLDGGAITLSAPNAVVTVNGEIDSSTGTGGTLAIDGAVVTTAPTVGLGSIAISGGGNLVLSSPLTFGATITLTSRLDIILEAAVGTSGVAQDITFEADSDDNGTGGIWIKATGQAFATGSVTLRGSSLVDVGAAGQAVLIDADGVPATAQVQAGAAGGVTINGKSSGVAEENVQIDGVISGNGAVIISAAADLLFGAAGDVSSGGGTITLTADIDADGNGSLTQSDGSVINAGVGTITLSGADGVTIAQLVSTDATSSAVTITADSDGDNAGAVVDGGDTGGVDIDAASGGVVITTATGIGAVNALETTIASADLQNSTSGAIQIAETDGLAVIRAAHATGGAISVSAAGLLSVTTNGVSAAGTGNVALTSTGNDVVISAAVNGGDGTISVAAGGGSPLIQLGAGLTTVNRDILLNSPVQLTGDVTLSSDLGAGDVNVAGTVDATAPGGQSLSISAGTGAIDLQGTVGTTALSAVTVNSADTARFGSTVTTTGAQSVTATTIQTNGTHLTSNNPITFTGAVELQAATTLDTQATDGTTGDVSIGAVTGAGFDLTVDTGHFAGADISVTSVANVGVLTIRDAGTATFTGSVGATTVAITDATTEVAFQDVVTADDLTVPIGSGGYAVSLTGDGSEITNGVTFANTGALTLGDADTDTLTFTGGVTATANSSRTVAGEILTSNTALTLGAITLAGDTTLDTQATTGAGDLTLGAVTGAGFDLTVDTGHFAGADISATSVAGAGVVTIRDAGTATFTGSVDATTVAITDATTEVAFEGAVTADDLTVPGTATAYAVSLTGDGSEITNGVTFANTGALTLGEAGETLTFTGGVTATANSSRTVAGTIRTSNTALTLGAITLAGDTTLDTQASDGTTGDVSIGAVTGAGFDLTVDTGHFAGADISATSVAGAGVVTIRDAGTATFTGSVDATTVAITDAVTLVAFQDVVAADDLTVPGTATAYAVSLTGDGSAITNGVTFANTGALTLGDADTDTLTFTGGVTATANSSRTVAGEILTSNTGLTLGSITLGADTTLDTQATDGTTGDVSIGAVTGAGFDLTVDTGHFAGADISVTSVANVGVLTIRDAGTATFTGSVGATTVAITDAVTLVAFQDVVTADDLTVPIGSGGYAVSLTGDGSEITNGVTFANTGALTLGDADTDTLTFTGGVTATANSSRTVAGEILTSNTALTLGAITLAGDTTLDTQATTGAGDLTLGAVTGAGFDLTVDTGHFAGADISATSVAGAGVVTIRDAGTATFTGSVDATTVAITDATTEVAFEGAVTADDLTVPGTATAYAVSLTGDGSEITNGVTFANTGALTLGEAGETLTFTGGVTATANSSRTVAGTIRTSNTALTLGAITLAGDTTLDTQASDGTTGDVSIGAVTGAGFDLTVDTGHFAGADISATSVAGAGVVTIRDAGTATFTGSVDATTVAITDAVTEVDFQGAVTADDLTVPGTATAYAVSLTGDGSTITNGVTFANTGALTLGEAGETLTFTGGVTATEPGTVTVAGTISTGGAGGQNVQLGDGDTAVVLQGDTAISTGAAAITLGGAVDADAAGNNRTLTLNTTGTTTLSGVVGGTESLLSLTTNAGGTTALNGTAVTTAGDQSYNDNVTVGAGLTLVTTANGDVAFGGTVTGARDVAITTDGTGEVTLGGDVTVGATAADAVRITAAAITLAVNSDISTAAVDGDITLTVDGLNLDGTNTVDAGTGTVTLTPRTASYTVEFGDTDSVLSTDVYYSSAWNGFTAGSFTVGAAGHDGDIVLTGVAGAPYSLDVINGITGGIRVGADYTASDEDLTLDAGSGGIEIGNNAVAINLGTGSLTAVDALTLTGDATITANGGVDFQSTVDGPQAVTVNSVGTTTFADVIGSTTALAAVTTNTGGTANINGGEVTTTGNQDFGDNVVLAADTTFTANAGSEVRFRGILGGGGTARSVTVTTANARFDGAVGGAGNLISTLDVDGTTRIDAASITTSGTQTYIGAVTVGSNTTLSAGSSTINAGATTLADGVLLRLGDGSASTINFASVDNLTTANSSNLTINTTGVVTVSGAVGATNALNAVTVTQSGGTTFQSTVNAATVTLTDTADGQTIAFQGNLTVGSGMTISNGGSDAYNVSITGATNTIAGDTDFLNGGSVTLGDGAGDSLTFTGGLATTGNGSNPGTVNVAGTVATAGAQMDIGAYGVSADATLTVGASTLNAGAATVADGATLTLGDGSGSTINAGAVDNTSTANSSSLTINTTGVVTVSGAVGATNALNAVTVTQSGGTTFQSTVDAATVTLTDTADAATIAFQGNLTVGSGMTISNGGSDAYNVSITGATNTIAGDTDFLNGGSATLGDGAGDSLTFTGGLATTGNGSNPGTVNVAGTVATAGTQMDIGAYGVSADATLTVGASTLNAGAATVADGTTLTLGDGSGSTINAGAVDNTSTANSSSLTINTTGVVTVSGAVGATNALNTVTVTQSGGTTFQSTVNAATVTLTDTADAATIAFQGNLTVGSGITISNGGSDAYAVSITGATNTIAGDTDFLNGGSVTLGDGAGDSLTFTGGVTATAPGTVTVAGTISTGGAGGQNVQLGDGDTAVVLQGDTAISTGAAAITLGGAVNADAAGNNRTLTLNTTGTTTLSGVVGGTESLLSLTTNVGGTTALNGTAVTTAGDQSYNDNVTVGAGLTLVTTANGDVAFGGTVTGARDVAITTDGTGEVTLGGDVTVGATAADAVRITAAAITLAVNSDISTAAVDGDITLTVDGLNLDGTNTVDAGTGTVTLTPRTASYTVEFGDTDSVLSTDVYYSSAWNGFTAGSFTVGAAGHDGDIVLTGVAGAPYSLDVINGITGGIRVGADYTASDEDLTLDAGSGGIEIGNNAVAINLGTGSLTAVDALTLTGDATITANGGVDFQSTVDGPQAVTVNSVGTTTFADVIGSTTALAAVTTNTGGTANINGGEVTTTGNQDFGDNVVLAADTTFIANAGSEVRFRGTLGGGGTARSVTVTTANARFDGAVGGAGNLISTLDVDGTTRIDAASITTSGTQTYIGAVTVGADTILTATDSAIGFGAGIDGNTSGGESLQIEAGTADITIGGTIGAVQPLQSLTISGNDIELAGIGADTPADPGVAGNATVTADNDGRITLLGTNYRTGGNQTYIDTTSANGIVFQTGADGSIQAAGASGVTFNGDLYLDATGVTVTLLSNMDVSGRLVGYRGSWDIAGHTITVGGDFVLFGAAYEPDDLDFTTADNRRFAYPDLREDATVLRYFPGTAPGGGTYDSSDATFSAGTPAFAFAGNGLDGASLDVAGDFYVNGLDLTAGADWNLAVADNTDADPYADSNYLWGQPYSVFLHGEVSRSQISNPLSGSIAAAVVAAGHTNNGVAPNSDSGDTNTEWAWNGGSPIPGWDFLAPRIASAAIRKDDVIHLQLNTYVTNLDTDTGTSGWQGAINDRTPMVQYDGDSIAFDSAWKDELLTATTDDSPPAALDAFFFRTTGVRWNTDATGTSASASPGGNGTDRTGSQQTTVPDISWTKGIFHSAGGRNPAINYNRERANAAPAQPAPVWDGTVDEAGPVLHTIEYGRAASPAQTNPGRPYDGHNFFHLYYSEPVQIGTATWGGGQLTTAENAQSATALSAAAGEVGGDIRDSADQSGATGRWTDVVGYFRYDATLNGAVMQRGTRPGITPPVPAGTANALYRADSNEPAVFTDAPAPMTSVSQDQQLRIYLSGYSIGGDGDRFPGWHANVPDPATVTDIDVVANNFIVDQADNPVDHTIDTAVTRVRETTYGGNVAAPTPDAVADWLTGWDVDGPTISTYQVETPVEDSKYEIITQATGDPNFMNRLEMHVLDNASVDLSAAPDPLNPVDGGLPEWWDPENLAADPSPETSDYTHPNDRSNEGVRDSSWNFPDGLTEHDAFSLEQVSSDPYSPDFPLTNAFNTGFDTAVDTILFTGGTPINRANDSYLALTLQDSGHSWGPQTNVWVAYDNTQAYITDLAGNLLPSTTYPLRTIDRSPPGIILSLASADRDRMYVKFSEPVYGDAGGSIPIDQSDLTISGGTGSYAVTSITAADGSGSLLGKAEFLLDLDGPLIADDLLSSTIQPAAGNAIYDDTANPMSAASTRPITDVLLGVVRPVWATDAIGIGDLRTVRTFDGTGPELATTDITLQGALHGDLPPALPVRLYYDLEVPAARKVGDYWTAVTAPGLQPTPNGDARNLAPIETNGALRTFVIPGSDAEVAEGGTLEFQFTLEVGGNEKNTARLTDADDPRTIAPWILNLGLGYIPQRGGVTILNNVIYPERDESSILLYEIDRPGIVTIHVFTLDGSIVRTLQRGRLGSGEYRTAWDGRNNSGAIVARGIYFIRIVAPGIDEYRKVIVAKD